MLDKFLKIAGVNNKSEFYKLYPTEESFFKAFPNSKKQFQNGGDVNDQQQIMQIIQNAVKNHQDPVEALVSAGMPQEQAELIIQQLQEQQQEFKSGGIHIAPSKKGTFTAQATKMGMSVQEAARHILGNKDRYSPLMVKKANFARNFGGKKEFGGYTYQEGGETMPQEQMEQPEQQSQEQSMGQDQQHQQMMQQLVQMVTQALQKGMQPQQIIQMLVQQGVPQEVATQVVQMVLQQSQQPQGGPGQQYQPQGQQYNGPQPIQQDGGFINQSYLPYDYE